jgi:hypothetical protein
VVVAAAVAAAMAAMVAVDRAAAAADWDGVVAAARAAASWARAAAARARGAAEKVVEVVWRAGCSDRVEMVSAVAVGGAAVVRDAARAAASGLVVAVARGAARVRRRCHT